MKKLVEQENQKHESCDCIFCLSHCPDCGSSNINVRFKPEFNYSYEDGDEFINVEYDYDKVEIHCQNCDYWQRTDNSLLLNFISSALDLPSDLFIERKEDRTIAIRRYNTNLVKD